MQIGVEISRAVENKRIFVIETDEIIRAALQFMLHDENETHEIASLEQAYAKGQEWQPDLILLGRGIVEARGAEVVGEIAERLGKPKILVIAASDEDPLAHACVKAGAKGIVKTPLTIESVRYKVDVALGRIKGPMIPLNVLGPIARS
jgi:CheY-like chemotaxis protein